jgi:hypothetical protein
MTFTKTQPSALPAEIEVLFEEARHRRRRRWRWGLSVFVVVIVATAVPILVGQGGRPPHPVLGQGHRHRPTTTRSNSQKAPATPALNQPTALAVLPNGEVLIDNSGTDQILEMSPNGKLSVFAGDGKLGSSGDGGPAVKAELDAPTALAVAPDGTTYVAEADGIRMISPSGVISTLTSTATGDIALGPSGLLYVNDRGIQVVQPNGSVSTLIPELRPAASVPGAVSDNQGLTDDIEVDGQTFAFEPDAIAVSSSGALYIANSSPKLLLSYSAGVFSLVGAPGSSLESDYVYVCEHGLAAAPNGTIIVGNYGSFGLSQVSEMSISSLASGIQAEGLDFRPSGVAVSSSGEVYGSNDGESGASSESFLIAVDPDGTTHLLDVANA